MGKLLLKALKILLGLVLLGVLVFGIYWLVQYKKWPWWVGVAIFVGLMGLIIGVLFLKKWLFRRRERKFVQRIVEQDESVMARQPVGERQELKDLDSRWRQAAEILKHSHLRRLGNPLYVLPWYILLGETGSGKTVTLKSARLHAPVTDVSPPPGLAPTRNCDWWFFENLVVLDTAGRYTLPVDEVLDKEEWQKFLSLVVKYRRREPLNGVMLTIPADKLKTANEDILAETARSLRRRVDEVMRVLGAKLPVYILVTKIDQIMGISELGDMLPESALDQAMGLANQDLRHQPAVFADQTVEKVSERLKDMRLLLAARGEPVHPAFMLLPDEFSALKTKLRFFVKTVFEDNPYQETPILRGIYFVSGRQTGTVQSQLLQAPDGAGQVEEKLPGTAKGLFASDLISRILPEDRNIMSPLREFLSWKRLTKSLGLTAWATVVLCLCGLLTLSFIKNQETIDSLVDDLAKPPALTHELSKDLIIMSHLRTELLNYQSKNRNWWIPRMGLSQSLNLEKELKEFYSQMFHQGFLDRLDTGLTDNLAEITSGTPGNVLAAYTEHLVTRINLLDAVLKKKSPADLAQMPPPSYQVLTLDGKVIPGIAAEFSPLYMSYINWEPHPSILTTENQNLRNLLVRLAGLPNMNLNWLVDWANLQKNLNSVTLAEFWGANRLSEGNQMSVPAAFTVAGKKSIEQFYQDYTNALGNPSLVKAQKEDFDIWYRQQYYLAWNEFGEEFDQGTVRLNTAEDRQQIAEIMVGGNNPYFKLLDRMMVELKPFETATDKPEWMTALFGYEKIQDQAARNKTLTGAGKLGKVAQEGESILSKAMQATGTDDDLKQQEMIAKGAELDQAYEQALSQLLPATSSKDKSLSMAADVYSSEDKQGQPNKSPFQEAHIAFTQLANSTAQIFHGDPHNLFWRLLSGPFYYMLAYTTHEAACDLQTQWEGQVVAATADTPEKKLDAALFDQEKGVVWKFVDGPAQPFIGRDAHGYFARSYLGYEFPFLPTFLGFLDQGSSGQQMMLPEFKVTFSARPTTVNREAVMGPFATILIMDCNKGPQQMDNYNYPSNQTLTWVPDDCGSVTLQIQFEDFTLTKNWDGPNGFPSFLAEFRDGTRTYTPNDFPEFKDDLNAQGVTFIRVTYVITGSLPVRKLRREDAIKVPEAITECLGQ